MKIWPELATDEDYDIIFRCKHPSEDWTPEELAERTSPHCGIPYGIGRGWWSQEMLDLSRDPWVVVGCCSECGVWFTLTPPVLP